MIPVICPLLLLQCQIVTAVIMSSQHNSSHRRSTSRRRSGASDSSVAPSVEVEGNRFFGLGDGIGVAGRAIDSVIGIVPEYSLTLTPALAEMMDNTMYFVHPQLVWDVLAEFKDHHRGLPLRHVEYMAAKVLIPDFQLAAIRQLLHVLKATGVLQPVDGGLYRLAKHPSAVSLFMLCAHPKGHPGHGGCRDSSREMSRAEVQFCQELMRSHRNEECIACRPPNTYDYWFGGGYTGPVYCPPPSASGPAGHGDAPSPSRSSAPSSPAESGVLRLSPEIGDLFAHSPTELSLEDLLGSDGSFHSPDHVPSHVSHHSTSTPKSAKKVRRVLFLDLDAGVVNEVDASSVGGGLLSSESPSGISASSEGSGLLSSGSPSGTSTSSEVIPSPARTQPLLAGIKDPADSFSSSSSA